MERKRKDTELQIVTISERNLQLAKITREGEKMKKRRKIRKRRRMVI